MAVTLEFSVIATTQQQIDFLLEQIKLFEAKTRIAVHLQPLSWQTGRSELISMALYRHGADVSDVGSTWLGDLITMNALRPFEEKEVQALGGEAAYVPAAWLTGVPVGDTQVWAIPLVVSAVIFAYRQDVLQKAGVDEQGAFADFNALENTLQQVKTSGWPTSLVLPVGTSRYSTLHNICSWLWGAGSDILSLDGRRALLSQPKALAALEHYYGLHRFFDPAIYQSENKIIDIADSFRTGKAAVAVGGSWLAMAQSLAPEVRANLGVAKLPGASFVGTQSLVVWQHTRNAGAAFELIRYLNRPDIQAAYASTLNLMPSRVELLVSQDYAQDAMKTTLAQAALNGRSLPTMRLLGLVEEKIGLALEQIWNAVLADPDGELEKMIQGQLVPLCNRLNMTLES